jgi:ABC-type cobalamin/Fe3+-siderophores transport system ATPase subunit
MSTGPGFQTTLQLHGVSKRFVAGVGACSVGVTALRSASVEIRSGEVLVVAGPSGSGKTTLLLCAAGLLRCDSGEILGTGRRVVYRDLLQPARIIDPMSPGAVLLLDSCDDLGELTRSRATRVVADALASGAAVVLAAREPASCFALIPAAATISVVHLRLGETWGPRETPGVVHRVAESAGGGY